MSFRRIVLSMTALACVSGHPGDPLTRASAQQVRDETATIRRLLGESVCSNATLAGKYVIGGAGEQFTTLLGLSLLVRHIEHVGYITLNGDGTGTGRIRETVDTHSVDDDAVNVTYRLNADCTGTLDTSAPTRHYAIVVGQISSDGVGKDLHLADAVRGRNEALEAVLSFDPPGGCSNAHLAGTFEGQGSGGMGAQDRSAIFMMTFDPEAGTINGRILETDDAVHLTRAVSGTFTVDPDCRVRLELNVDYQHEIARGQLRFAPIAHREVDTADDYVGTAVFMANFDCLHLEGVESSNGAP